MYATGIEYDVEVGENAPWGEILEADAFTFVIKKDGTVKATSNFMGENVTQEGTWTEVDGEIAITIDGGTQFASIENGKLVMVIDEADALLIYTFAK